MTYKQVDDIVRLGKWAYYHIPRGDRCRSCLLLHKTHAEETRRGWYCDLQTTIALIHDEEGPFKDRGCPVERD